ncbi:hypothetical protein PGB90_003802 [Kerria lacca]
MVLKAKYRGFMAPVFTPFTSDGQLNLNEIPKYANYLSSKNVKAILVNGTVGEGALMNTDERKKVTEAWIEAAKITGHHIMVHIGSTNLNNVIKLAKHAESLQVDSILCLPDMFFRPTIIKELIDYLKIVSAAAPKTPLFYYNYPALTGVNLDMVKFLESAYSEIPTLAGLKYTHNNLDEGIRCVQLHDGAYTIYLGNDQLISAGLCVGFDNFILTTLNFASEEIFKIKEQIAVGAIENAKQIQRRITDLAYFVIEEMQWINGFKTINSLITGINLGQPRPPLNALTSQQLEKLKTELKKKNWT